MPQTIHWFRKDLRLTDNPALMAAANAGTVVPVYILDPAQLFLMGEASRVWLYHSLKMLRASLGGRLLIVSGNPIEVLPDLCAAHSANQVTWTRRYDPHGIFLDQNLKSVLSANGVTVTSLNGSLLWEPWEVLKPDQTPYRVFTPFYKRGCARAPLPRVPSSAPNIQFANIDWGTDQALSRLLPRIDWHSAVRTGWQPGETGALQALEAFRDGALLGYKTGRDIPALRATSRLSPHLHFGELSPNQIWHTISELPTTEDTAHFKSELAWREFSYHLLYRHNDLDRKNLNAKFDPFPWRDAPDDLKRWQKGQTGIPIVDAGMRELWQTGYMHNRVRMIVASFLTKNLMIHWRHGLEWFNDTLFDADPANNAASWQWVAGSGADAAPYFRIFNPVAQAQRFDSDGIYIRKYVPELAQLPTKYMHSPWEAKTDIFDDLSAQYPAPIVDLKDSRERALAAYANLSG